MACCGSAKAKEELKAGWLKFGLIAVLFGGGGLASLTYLTFVRSFRWFPLYWRVLRFFALLPYIWLTNERRKPITSLPVLLLFCLFLLFYGLVGLFVLSAAGLFSRTARHYRRALWSGLCCSMPAVFRELLNDSYIWRPELKCMVSGRLFRFSPAFSGLVFKYFNLIVIVAMVGLVSFIARAFLKLAG
ncbi:MAG TPA: hypothetical protein VM163_03805 [bacterium]|nr:hypothetical protein [bacterium]